MKYYLSIVIFSFIFSFCTHKREVKNEVVNTRINTLSKTKSLSKYPYFVFQGEDSTTNQYMYVTFIDSVNIWIRHVASSKIVDGQNSRQTIAKYSRNQSNKTKKVFEDTKNQKYSYSFEIDTSYLHLNISNYQKTSIDNESFYSPMKLKKQ